MKKIVVFAVALLATTIVSAQSERYLKAMQDNVSTLDVIRTAQGWTEVGNNFQRIADAEKTQWLPYYYAALSNVMTGYFQMPANQSPDPAKTDPLADKAEEALNKAEALSKDNSEIFLLRKMIATLRLTADPMNRWQTYGPQAAEALQKAKTLNPENPRVYMIEGQDKLYTPEQFGGSKTEAKRLFEEAEKKFGSFKAESAIHPQWGLSQVKYFQSQVQ
ncbi:MAG: hypothetical protein H7122_11945 [Chitinophagaceae bacterium]|nr:hypothetical protein [Chitinophagaceae bacterium]